MKQELIEQSKHILTEYQDIIRWYEKTDDLLEGFCDSQDQWTRLSDISGGSSNQVCRLKCLVADNGLFFDKIHGLLGIFSSPATDQIREKAVQYKGELQNILSAAYEMDYKINEFAKSGEWRDDSECSLIRS